MHQPHDPPDAFLRNFPRIKPAGGEWVSHLANTRPTHHYKMGSVRIAFCPEHNQQPDLLVLSCKNRYPTWDEIVYVRYSDELGIDKTHEFALILPALDNYINYRDGNHAQHTFTLENIRLRKQYWSKNGQNSA